MDRRGCRSALLHRIVAVVMSETTCMRNLTLEARGAKESRQASDIEAGPSTSQAAAPEAEIFFRELHEADLPELRELQRGLFPVQYSDNFYMRLLNEGHYTTVGVTRSGGWLGTGEIVAVASTRIVIAESNEATPGQREAYIMTLGVKVRPHAHCPAALPIMPTNTLQPRAKASSPFYDRRCRGVGVLSTAQSGHRRDARVPPDAARAHTMRSCDAARQVRQPRRARLLPKVRSISRRPPGLHAASPSPSQCPVPISVCL